jgi:hypothetical protein
VIQAVIDVVMHKSLLGLGDRFLYRMKLLSNVEARLAFLDHVDHGSEMALNSIQTLNDVGMALMYLGRVRHFLVSYPIGGDRPPRAKY